MRLDEHHAACSVSNGKIAIFYTLSGHENHQEPAFSVVTSENTYARFHGLEQLTKSGLVAYLFLLIAGGIVAGMGTDRVMNSLSGLGFCAYALIVLLLRDSIFLLVRGVNRIDWLGRLHLWVDDHLFGFASKSNAIIFREFTLLLDPAERSALEQLPDERKKSIAESVIANLAEDQSIFESLMQRGIFRSWIYYWIALYGVLVFILLTVLALWKMVLFPTIYTRALCFSISSVALLHGAACLFLGYNVILVTKRITQEFGRYFRTEIVTILRQQTVQN
jgi:hypothetical protein